MAGAKELSIKTSDNQNYYLTSSFNPSLAKVYSESSAGSVGQASQMHGQGLFKAITQAANHSEIDSTGLYAGFDRSDLRHETGSHADVKGNTLSVAVSFKAKDSTSWGIFGQKFTGNYTTSHDVSLSGSNQSINSNGKLKSHDIGLFAEYRPSGQDSDSGSYYQTVVRTGRLTNEFRAANVSGLADSSFNSGRKMFGFSLGGGYVENKGQEKSADYYGHLIYTKLGGDSLTDSIGQTIDLKSSKSVRLLSGARYNLKHTQKLKTFAGAALDYEFKGKSDAYINNAKADSANLKGLSAMLELGVKLEQSNSLSIEFGLQGYLGKKRGLGGNMSVIKRF